MYNFAIVGCGAMGERHALFASRYGNLAAVCDILPSRAERLASLYRAKTYTLIDAMLAAETGIDIVCVCTPNGFHAEHCIKSLQAGKQVLCESPLCLTTAAAWQIIETEKFCRKKLFLVDTVAASPVLPNLKNEMEALVQAGQHDFEIICLYGQGPGSAPDWHTRAFPGGGALYTGFTNYIQLIQHLFGELERVQEALVKPAGRSESETEKMGRANLVMRSGATIGLEWTLHQESRKPGLYLIDGKPRLITGDLHQLVWPEEELYISVYNDYTRALEEDQVSNLYQGMKTVETIEKIYRSVSPKLPWIH